MTSERLICKCVTCSRAGAAHPFGAAINHPVMKTLLLTPSLTPLLAQAAAGGLAQGASSAMGVVMLIAFIFGTICVIGGGFAVRRGDTDAGKLSIVGGLIIAGAPVIVKALFTAFGLGNSTVDVGSFQ
jgi:hypothetical protein